jgi:ATP-binding protein involved in chromosome partitioning
MTNPLTPLDNTLRAQADLIQDPLTGEGLARSGRIVAATLDSEGIARVTLEAPEGEAQRFQAARAALEAALLELPAVQRALVVLTAHQTKAAKARRPQTKENPAPAPAPRQAEGLHGVTAIMAVASAKGGVGKSTVAVNLACAFAALGFNTGLLDLDVYGPSVPTLLGVANQQPRLGSDKKLIPLEAHGLKTMSIGYLVDPESPIVWRGAMATSAVRQMLDDVAWAPLDILILDMPPGTGDVQLTIAQRVPLSGAVIVSTPQEVALADVRRGIAMFEKTHVPILGIVENMAWLEQAGGQRLHIFGEGGAQRTAQATNLPFLGELPIEIALRESADAGLPLVASAPESPMAKRFIAIAEACATGIAAGMRPPPTIRFIEAP